MVNENLIKLTNREKQVFDFIMQGLKTREIREKMNIAKSTIRTYYKHLYEKTFVSSKKELIRKFGRK